MTSFKKDIVCQKCGVLGYKEALVYCMKCNRSAEHRYCFDDILQDPCADVSWSCEQCILTMPTQVAETSCLHDSLKKVDKFGHEKTLIDSDVFVGKKAMRYQLLQTACPKPKVNADLLGDGICLPKHCRASRCEAHRIPKFMKKFMKFGHQKPKLKSDAFVGNKSMKYQLLRRTYFRPKINANLLGDGICLMKHPLRSKRKALHVLKFQKKVKKFGYQKPNFVSDVFLGKKPMKYQLLQTTCPRSKVNADTIGDSMCSPKHPLASSIEAHEFSCNGEEVQRKTSGTVIVRGHRNDSGCLKLDGGIHVAVNSNLVEANISDEQDALAIHHHALPVFGSINLNVSDSQFDNSSLKTFNSLHPGERNTVGSKPHMGKLTAMTCLKKKISPSRLSSLQRQGSVFQKSSDSLSVGSRSIGLASVRKNAVAETPGETVVVGTKEISGVEISVEHGQMNGTHMVSLSRGSRTDCEKEVAVKKSSEQGIDISLSHSSVVPGPEVRQRASGPRDALCNEEKHWPHDIIENVSSMMAFPVSCTSESGDSHGKSAGLGSSLCNYIPFDLRTCDNVHAGGLIDERVADNRLVRLLDDDDEPCNISLHVKKSHTSNDANSTSESSPFLAASYWKPSSVKDGSNGSILVADITASDGDCSNKLSDVPGKPVNIVRGKTSESCSSQGTLKHSANEVILPVIPLLDPIWSGCFDICNGMYGPMMGHLSMRACKQAVAAAMSLPPTICLQRRPRLHVWPESFKRSPPSADSIGLFLFPGSYCMVATYIDILNDVTSKDLGLSMTLPEAELLIFSSIMLPAQYQEIHGNMFLWGVFKARKNLATSPSIGYNSKTEANQNGKNRLEVMVPAQWKTVEQDCTAELLDLKLDSCRQQGRPISYSDNRGNAKNAVPTTAKVEISLMSCPHEISKAKSIFVNNNLDEVWNLIGKIGSTLTFIRPWIPQLLMCCADPPHFVLDALSKVMLSAPKIESAENCARGCSLLLSSLQLIIDSPELASSSFAPEMKERARGIADSWKVNVLKKWSNKDKFYLHCAYTFLLLVITFRILDEAEKPLYRELVMSLSKTDNISKIAASLNLGDDFMRFFIKKLIKSGNHLAALNFIHDAGLVECFPLIPLFKSYLNHNEQIGDGRWPLTHQFLDKILRFKIYPDAASYSLMTYVQQLEHQTYSANASSNSQEKVNNTDSANSMEVRSAMNNPPFTDPCNSRDLSKKAMVCIYSKTNDGKFASSSSKLTKGCKESCKENGENNKNGSLDSNQLASLDQHRQLSKRCRESCKEDGEGNQNGTLDSNRPNSILHDRPKKLIKRGLEAQAVAEIHPRGSGIIDQPRMHISTCNLESKWMKSLHGQGPPKTTSNLENMREKGLLGPGPQKKTCGKSAVHLKKTDLNHSKMLGNFDNCSRDHSLKTEMPNSHAGDHACSFGWSSTPIIRHNGNDDRRESCRDDDESHRDGPLNNNLPTSSVIEDPLKKLARWDMEAPAAAESHSRVCIAIDQPVKNKFAFNFEDKRKKGLLGNGPLKNSSNLLDKREKILIGPEPLSKACYKSAVNFKKADAKYSKMLGGK